MNRPMICARLAPAVLALLLAACGGGGGDASAPPPSPGPGDRASCALPNFQAELLARVNAARAAGASCGSAGNFPAVPALAWQGPLQQAALSHSEDMVAHDFFDHRGSDGSHAGQRLTAAGYAWRGWGENIAAGQPTVAAAVDGWLASPGHCANLLKAEFRDIGVACVAGGASNRYRSYWTLVLATPR